MPNINKENDFTFWDHLEEFRKILFRIIIAIIIFMIIAFIFKDILFIIIFAPSKSDFIIYRAICFLAQIVSFPNICPEEFNIQLINTQLASQFFVHMKIAMLTGILFSAPYIIYQLFHFISPALYQNEKQCSKKVIFYSATLFFSGVLLNYFLIFPLSFRFLSTYQVSDEIVNMINLESYIDTFLMLSLMIGIMSEIPIISWAIS